MKITVIDGLGGGLGSQIIDELNSKLANHVELIALGTNARATSNMIESGADWGATGENPIKVNSAEVDIIVGPLGIIIPNSMHGEITPVMAEAIADSKASKFLIGIRQPHVQIMGMKDLSINEMIEEVTKKIKSLIEK